MASRNHLDPKRLSDFRKFEIIAHSVVEGFISGFHKSPFKGLAIEFAEHRPYVHGDDLKHLDWRVLAKEDRYYIRQYEEDTELSAYIVLDRSGSMGYRSGDHSKLDYGRFIAAVLSYLLISQNDAVGLITFDQDVDVFLPPRTTSRHMKRILDALEESKPGGDTNLGEVLHALANRLKRRALIVVISDFFDELKQIQLALSHFAHKRHEVSVFQVLDRKEADFPFKDPTRFESLEGEYFEITDPIRLRKEYIEQFMAHQQGVRKACHGLRIDFVPFFTDQPFEKAMAKYLSGRPRK